MRKRIGRWRGVGAIGAVLLLAGCAEAYRTPYDAPPPLVYAAPEAPAYGEPPYYAAPSPLPDYYAPPIYVPGPTLYLEERLRDDRRRQEFEREARRREQERRLIELREAERRQHEQRPTIPVAPPRPPVVQAQPPQSAPHREPERRRSDCDPARRYRCD